MELGTNIWRARKQLQLSQEQLGAIVGVTRQTISNWELNETVPDAKQLLARIAVQLRKQKFQKLLPVLFMMISGWIQKRIQRMCRIRWFR